MDVPSPLLLGHLSSLTSFIYIAITFQVLSIDANIRYRVGENNLVPLSYCEYLCSVQKCNISFSDNQFDDDNFKRQLYGSGSKYKRQATDSPDVGTKLTISAGNNQTIQLPMDQAVLSSFVVPSSSNYKYNWELISPLNREDIGNIEGLNKNQVKLSHLKAGNYTFRVTVTGENDKSGSAVVNLTVLPPKTLTKPPIVIIEPKNSTVQLPNKDTVLDGSSSSSYDGQIVKYEWQAIKVPIGYKNLLSNSSILRLNDLVPGLYVFNLTVTDSRNATNSTTATINVLKEIDYPPTANAGPDIVLFLPQNEVTLNGNKSTDDKEITSWHWTRADDGQMGLNMDGATTAYLHLSKLEVGVYKFILQVTDSSNQISKAETHVFVKPENNVAPKADAGGDLEIILPVKSPTFLDGSKSSDDISIAKWEWKQIDGPKTLNILEANTSIARIENITPGKYNFSLTVWDTKDLNSTAYKLVTVIQDKNIPPKAIISGGDKTVTLPVNEVFLDGSSSYDDAEIVSFRWERMALSLAYGDLIGNSSNSSILRLTNLVAGRYLFQLTVTDAHGASNSEVASLIVKPPIDILNQIEMVLNHDIQSFTFDQQTNIYRRLEILLSEGDSVKISSVKVDKTRERRTILTFTACDSNNNALPSVPVVRKIKATLKSDPNFLSIQVITLDTSVCQNNCSFHGTCDQYTKRCMCEAFWMENFIRFYFGDSESNCDWSILYASIICFAVLVSITVFLWICICFISRYHQVHSSQQARRRKFKRTNRFRYMLIDSCDNVEMVASNHNHHKPSHSDLSDSDQSETLFSTNAKRNQNNHAAKSGNNKLNAIT